MKNIITESGIILALALFCQVRAQFSGSFVGRVPEGRPGRFEVGLGSGHQYDPSGGMENEMYGPEGYPGYGGPNNSIEGLQGGPGRPIPQGNRPPGWFNGYYPGGPFQGGNAGRYPEGRPQGGFNRPGLGPVFRPPYWTSNYYPGDATQGGYYAGGRPIGGFSVPGRRPGRRPLGFAWANGFYPGIPLQGGYGGYFPVNGLQGGLYGPDNFYGLGKPQGEISKPGPDGKPTENVTDVPQDEKPTQNGLEEGAELAADSDDLPIYVQGHTTP